MNVWVYHDQNTNIIRVFNKKEAAMQYVSKVKKDYDISIKEENGFAQIYSDKNKEINIRIMQRKVEGVLEPQQNAFP